MRFSLLVFPSLATAWNLEKFTNLVVFGNSYTDESRWDYFASHNGSAPPVGWDEPVSNNTDSGGFAWPRFVVNQTGTKLSDYAVSGADCSKEITSRIEPSTKILYPSVLEYEVPAYLADSASQRPPFESTVYAIWIGTNDIGYEGFLTDSQNKNSTLADYVNCVYRALDNIYHSGARNFVLMNLAPLHLTPLYAVPEKGGVTGKESQYWPWKPENLTEISHRMKEQVVALNQVFDYRTPYEVLIAKRYPGASFAVMDTYGLLSDVYYNDTNYPNITNVTGYTNHCDQKTKQCTRLPNPETFLWFDELHPSEQTDKIIAEQFIQVVKGESKWASYW
ncbi:SGNH/GDSL hydrolase family protein [Aspergillus ruber CBS 135680]|uniref:GDSL lipase/acylhydrolase family protein n=1 Tax=Aspergillus ruber (strain CBS 135680) TaxID=1388766 RepID=A0A017S2U2_ASPRC|nr:GDSL lipase/acylhydrolase family protein [Aspergillus ruber CBS 135680]EYE91353.1 GDSL lipase/acylhydrolase family protein [Aspergillus ruber CBS 135680]